ncbi:MAG: tRNA (N(6)-L-threonylcarbamoyladenosine(37)-C(2))-methylthiotransferase MtaB [Candidatus Kuenenia sp.]|nr:tRNA (N(6)-L-threonylcarbamoyladenosine(37)-C(2))-methylthiotransferase MtaB [Candidatus Kuenenia hertensis]
MILNTPKTCAFITLGCKVNQYETQAIRESLIEKGFMEISPEMAADIYVINTCTVTSASDEKSRSYIKHLKKRSPHSTIVVTGCYAESDADAIKKIDGVSHVITKAEESSLAEIVADNEPSRSFQTSLLHSHRLQSDLPHAKIQKDSIYHLKISHFQGHTKAFLKIEDGCDMYCSYCIIPYVRGNIKSRKWQDIQDEAKRLIQNGYKEIVLTGIHLGAYGKETPDSISLVDILEKLSNLSGMGRIRLSSIEVNEVTLELIRLVAEKKNICPHFHIPLQSGDNFILKRMNRKYTSDLYLEILDTIREKIELPSFTTDVMVGFPGETDTHFENTVNLCMKAGYSRMHIFPFSVRKGTPAANMQNHCPPKIIAQRKTLLKAQADTLAFSYKKHFLNSIAEVLVETERDSKTNKLCGYSERYIKVLFDGPDALKNSIVPVQIEKITPSVVFGKLYENETSRKYFQVAAKE